MALDFALTFDDGPGPATSELLDTLDEFGIRGTFFLVGANLESAPWCSSGSMVAWNLVRRMIESGHIVGNHTMQHSRSPGVVELIEEIEQCDRLIDAAYRSVGRSVLLPIPFRLPYGVRLITDMVTVGVGQVAANFVDPRLMTIAMVGRTHVHWTALFNDWDKTIADAPSLADDIVRHVEDCIGIGASAVIALHDGGLDDVYGYDRTATVRAVRYFLQTAQRRGWQSFTVPA